jgi:hypothetical protein
MKSLIGSFEDAASDTPPPPRRLAIRKLLVIGLPLTAFIALADLRALQACGGLKEGWLVYATYTLFVVQTGALAALVGSQLRSERLWWLIFAWGILLVDIQVFALAGPADQTAAIKKLGFAIASAQLGMLTCLGVLGSGHILIRLPIALVGLTLSLLFAGELGGNERWQTLLLLQCIATAIVCAALRWFSFRIVRQELSGPGAGGNLLQFSIRHLFYWTTGVAITVAIGRYIGWKALLSTGMEIGRTPEMFVFVPLLSLTSVIAMWSALGKESWPVRLPVLLLALPAAGFVFGTLSSPQPRWKYDSLFYDWKTTRAEAVVLGIIWSLLAGALLAGLLLVFRMNSQRLQRGAATKS